jgi:uncharacterized protein
LTSSRVKVHCAAFLNLTVSERSTMKKALGIAIVLLAVLAAVYLAGSWYFSGIIVKFNAQSLEQQQARHGSPADYGLPTPEEVTIPGDGVTLAGWYFDNPAGGDCGVILLHGHTGSRYGMLKYAPLLWPLGCDLLLYDHRFHGASTGEFGTYGYHEKQDALAALAWFQQRTGLQPGQIGLLGESYGAATALQAGSLAPELAFIAGDSSYRNLESIIAEQAAARFGAWVQLFAPGALGIAGLRADFAPSRVSPLDAAGGQTAPVFLSHSASDEYTLPQHSVDIAAQLPAALCSRLHLTDWGAGHGNSINDDFAVYQAQFTEFLAACAPGFGNSD